MEKQEREQVLQVPLTVLTPSNFNPRSKYSNGPQELKDLAASIAEKGVQQPILVRPIPHPSTANPELAYEIVYGERRFLASKQAGKKEIPAIVRDLTDAEAMEAAIIENLQRSDLHFIDEAQGFKRLLNTGLNREQIAEKVGKPAVYVAGRLGLTHLTGKAISLAHEGKLGVLAAVKLGRLTEAIQLAILKEARRYGDGSQPVSQRDIDHILKERVYRNLANAPFATDVADLVPKAGACTTCLKRTGANPLLFADVKQDDVCTDSNCYMEKCAALVEVKLKAFPKAIRIMNKAASYEEKQEGRKYGFMSEDEYGGGGWRASSKGACDSTVDGIIAIGPNTGAHLIVCPDKKCPVHAGRYGDSGGRGYNKTPGVMDPEKKKQQEQLWQRRTARAIRLTLHAAVRKVQEQDPHAYRNVPLEALRMAVTEACKALRPQMDGVQYLETLWIPPKGSKQPDRYTSGPVMKCIAGATDHATLIRILIDYVVAQDVASKYQGGELIYPLVKAYDLDAKAIAAPIEKDWNERKRVSYEKRDKRLAGERDKLKKVNATKDPAPKGKLKSGATVLVTPDFLKQAEAVNSSGSISDQSKILGILQLGGRSWACIRSCSVGDTLLNADLVEVLKAADWKDEAVAYNDKKSTGYVGVKVSFGGKQYVLGRTEITLKPKGTKDKPMPVAFAHTGDCCRYCGCTEAAACQTPDGPCSWVVKPKLTRRGKAKNVVAGVCSNPICAKAHEATTEALRKKKR